MKILGWMCFAIGAMAVLVTVVGYFTGDGVVGVAGPKLITGLGCSAVPLVIGLVILSREEKKNKPKA